MSAIFDALSRLGDEFAAHVMLCAAALSLAIGITLPLAIWAARSANVSRVALGFASLVQTIPALALLALFFPILLSLRAVFGEGLPTLGFLPALLALALYALLPILRNAVTAQANLDPGVLQAADGVGMNAWQKLRLVEAPLSAPYIMGGIRTAAVWTIGAATLATTIGQKSLGDPIFAGLQTQNWALVLAGCIASAGLALVADGLLGLIERGFAKRNRAMWIGGMVAVALGVLVSLWTPLTSAIGAQQGEDNRQIVIGTKTFSEQFILGRLIGQQLEKSGFSVEYRDALGSAVVHEAVTSGEIDISIDYTGTLWANQLQREDRLEREAMYRAIVAWEQETSGTLVLGRLGFANNYAFAMRREPAIFGEFNTIEDIAERGAGMTIGGDPEFFERPEWRGVRDIYGLQFSEQRSFSPTFMYDALKAGEVDVIAAYTSDGRIAADRLSVLEDNRGAFPTYDALILIAPQRAQDADLIAALTPLIGAIDIEAMRAANYAVDRMEDKQTPAQAAQDLAARIGLD